MNYGTQCLHLNPSFTTIQANSVGKSLSVLSCFGVAALETHSSGSCSEAMLVPFPSSPGASLPRLPFCASWKFCLASDPAQWEIKASHSEHTSDSYVSSLDLRIPPAPSQTEPVLWPWIWLIWSPFPSHLLPRGLCWVWKRLVLWSFSSVNHLPVLAHLDICYLVGPKLHNCSSHL